MKKTIITFLSIFFIATTFSQSSDKNNYNIDFEVGFGVYDLKQIEIETITSPNSVTTNKDKELIFALNCSFASHLEYKIGNKIGFGGSVAFNNLIIYNLSEINLYGSLSNEELEQVKGLGFGLNLHYHFLKLTKHDFLARAGFDINVPIIVKTSERKANDFSGSGISWRVEIIDRIFSSKRIGGVVRVGYEGGLYKVTINDNYPSFKSETKNSLTLNGVIFGFGISLKF